MFPEAWPCASKLSLTRHAIALDRQSRQRGSTPESAAWRRKNGCPPARPRTQARCSCGADGPRPGPLAETATVTSCHSMHSAEVPSVRPAGRATVVRLRRQPPCRLDRSHPECDSPQSHRFEARRAPSLRPTTSGDRVLPWPPARAASNGSHRPIRESDPHTRQRRASRLADNEPETPQQFHRVS